MKYSKTWVYEYKLLNQIMRKYKLSREKAKTTLLAYIEQGIQMNNDAPVYIFNLQRELNADIPHIFFEDKELKDFLLSTKIHSLSGINEHLRNNGIKTELGTKSELPQIMRDQIDDYIADNTVIYEYSLSYNIHIPNEEYGYTFYYSYCPQLDRTAVWVKNDRTGYNVWSAMSDNDPKHNVASMYKESDTSIVEAISFALNFLFYILCFPEMLIDGLIHKAKDINFNKGFTLKTSEKVVTEHGQNDQNSKDVKAKGTKCTHFRNGFFKHLTSDRFNNKKGEWVFVKSCVVNSSKVKTCLNI